MRKTFIRAHEMTREIKAQYPEVDYRAQFAINLSYLLNKEEEGKVRELKGTEKQVKWANDIMAIFDEVVVDVETGIERDAKNEEVKERQMAKLDAVKARIDEMEDAGEIINNYKKLSYMDEMARLHAVRKVFKDEFAVSISIKYWKYAEEKAHEQYENR